MYRYTLRIKFFQSNKSWIQRIQRIYPFLKDTHNSRRKDECRIEYELRAAGKQIEPLVDDLLKYSILKYEQLTEAKKFFQFINIPDTSEQKELIYNKLKQLKKSSINKPYNRLSKEYIAGLFDAEGSIGIYTNSLRVKITQKSDTLILQKIAEMYSNTNKIDNYAISFYGINSLNLLNDILPHCIYKTPQIQAAINYIESLNLELTGKTSDIFKSFSREQLLTIIHMKHQNKTTQEVSNYINEHYNISINRHLISKLWNGNQYVTLPNEILESEEYSKMIENKKQRTVKAKKFNDEEIEWLLKNNLTSPLNTRIKLFYEKYNKTITKAYLSKLSKI